MKLEIVKNKLLYAINACERIAGKHVSLPVLSCVLLEAKGNELKMKATNLDVGIEIDLQAKVSEVGIVAVSGGVIKSFLTNSFGDKSVFIESMENNLSLKTEDSHASIKTMSSEDFPAIPRVAGGSSFKIDSKEFVNGVNAVFYSASLSSIKPELSSVFIYPDREELVFVATDSFRLAEKRIKSKKTKDAESILIPFKNIQEIARILTDLNSEIEIRATKNQVSFFAPGLHITSRVVDGNFPDYKQIIPKDSSTSITVLKQDFSQALKLTSAFSDTFNQVILSINSAKKTLEIKTKNNEIGEGVQTIKGSVAGEDLVITFNHKYIYDCLQSIESESLILKFAGLGKPLLISGASNATFTYLVMPMNR